MRAQALLDAVAVMLLTSTVTIAVGGASASFTLPEGGSVTLYRVAPR